MGRWFEGIEASFSLAAHKSPLGSLLLDEKMIRVKFKKNIVATSQTIYRNRILVHEEYC
jgi:hypothetical protein